MSTVYECARTLVRALRESEESKQMRRLGSRVKGDGRLEGLLSDFRQAQWEVQMTQMQGSQPSQKQAEQLQKLTKTVEGEALLHEYLMAEAAYGKVLMEIQQVLAEAFHPEVPGAVKDQKPGR